MASNRAKVVTLPVPARRAAAGLIRQARNATGLSQEAAAEKAKAAGVDISVRTLRDIELGRVRMTALELLVFLQALGESKRKAA